MNKGKWIEGEDKCPRCDKKIEQLEWQEMILGERCTKCRWQIDLSGDSPRRVAYSGV